MSANSAIPASASVGPARAILSCFVPFAAAYFIGFIFRTINAIIGADLAADMGLDAAGLGLLTSGYFFAFAIFQLPLGILLDRFGPRRVEGALLLVAAAGAILFAAASSVAGLTAARAVIGIGVSGCLMGAIKANVQFWPRERLPLLNGAIMASGGLGALAAALPVEWLLRVSDWRTVFLVLAVPTAAVALLMLWIVPEKTQAERTTLRDLLRGLGQIYRSPVFWRIAPSAFVGQAVFMAYHSLWAGLWMRDVIGLDRAGAAAHLSLFAIAMIPAYLGGGALAERLLRYDLAPHRIFAAFVSAYLTVQAAIALSPGPGSEPLWVAYSITGTGMVISFSLLTPSFSPAYAGRVNTALNLMVFVAAFLMQVGIGTLITLLAGDDPSRVPLGHRASLIGLLAVQAACFVWLLWPRRSLNPGATGHSGETSDNHRS